MHALDQPLYRLAADPEERTRAVLDLLDNDSTKLPILLQVLARTDDIARQLQGVIANFPPSNAHRGPFAAYVNVPFVRILPGRFNDHTYGAWYAADSLTTSWAEKHYHLVGWLSAVSGEKERLVLQQRLFVANIGSSLHDLRKPLAPNIPSAIYDPKDYSVAQAFAAPLRNGGSYGVWFNSVRRPQGFCAGIFVPRVVSNVELRDSITLIWDNGTLEGAVNL